MRRASVIIACLSLVVGLAAPAYAGLDGFLAGLNAQAKADPRGFSLKLVAQFGVGDAEVQAVLRSVPAPADAFMCFQLGEFAHQPPDVVLGAIKTERGKGWGAVAQRLGIAPGSPEFQALKRGDFALTGKPKGKPAAGQGKGKGHRK